VLRASFEPDHPRRQTHDPPFAVLIIVVLLSSPAAAQQRLELRCERAVHQRHEQSRRQRTDRPHVHPKTDDRLEHRRPRRKTAVSARLPAEAGAKLRDRLKSARIPSTLDQVADPVASCEYVMLEDQNLLLVNPQDRTSTT
jgi:hypothetical protein